MNYNKKLAVPYAVFLIMFVAIPLALVLIYALSVPVGSSVVPSLENFRKFLDPIYFSILFRSVKLAFIATIFCLFLGYPMAHIIASEKKNRRRVMLLMIVIPMWMNFLLRTYAWFSLLGKNGIINRVVTFFGFHSLELMYTDLAVVIGMVYNFLPFMVLPIYSVLSKIDFSLYEAAYDLGATGREIFMKITWPLSIAGVFSGISMVFIPAVSTFVISNLLGGNKYNLIGNVIEQQFRWTGDWHFGSAMSIILMIFILIAMGVSRFFGGDLSKGEGLL